MKNKHLSYFFLGLFVYVLIFIFPTLDCFYLFDWDEINFAESSREMLLTGDYFHVQINFEPFHEKPPLFFWLQSLSMKIFGIDGFAARFPNALLAFFTPITLFFMGKTIKDYSFGVLWASIYMCGILPSLYFRTGIIDPYFNLFIFTSIFFGYVYLTREKSKRRYQILLSGLFAGLALITKGPVALLLIFLVFFLLFLFKKVRIGFKNLVLFSLSVFVCSIFWYGHEIWQSGPWFFIEFLKYQIELFSKPVAGHQQPFYYHFVVLLFGCFPFSFFAIKNTLFPHEKGLNFEYLMRILFWVVLVLFTIVTTKIVHYSSLAYFPLSYLAVVELRKIKWGKTPSNMFQFLFVSFAFILTSIFSISIYLLSYKTDFLIALTNNIQLVEILKTPLVWNGYEFLLPLSFLIAALLFMLFYAKRLINAIVLFLVFNGIFFTTIGYWVLPNIDLLVQGNLINYYESISNEKKYISTVGFKSYAHYFYAKADELTSNDELFNQKQKILKEEFQVSSFHELTKDQKNKFSSHIVNWMIVGNIDRPCYFVTKINRTVNQLENNKNLEVVFNRSGFKIFKRKVK